MKGTAVLPQKGPHMAPTWHPPGTWPPCNKPRESLTRKKKQKTREKREPIDTAKNPTLPFLLDEGLTRGVATAKFLMLGEICPTGKLWMLMKFLIIVWGDLPCGQIVSFGFWGFEVFLTKSTWACPKVKRDRERKKQTVELINNSMLNRYTKSK